MKNRDIAMQPTITELQTDGPVWLRQLRRASGQHRVVTEMTAPELPARKRRRLLRSLATFQIGETGTGEHLFAAAERSGADEAYMEGLRLFIAEEQEHARLLALVLDDAGHTLLERHWTDAVFVLLRRFKSLRTEVLTLMVAETIALRYYAAMRDGLAGHECSEIFARIHADEIRHVDFHCSTLPDHLRRFEPSTRLLGKVLWNVLVAGTSVLIALDHGGALKVVGVTRRAFVRDVSELRRDISARMFAD